MTTEQAVRHRQIHEASADQETLPTHIDQLFARQRATALALRASTAAQRADKLRRLADALLSRREALYAAFASDFAKPPAEVESTELLPVIEEVRHALRHLKGWMAPRRVSATWPTLGTSARVEMHPRGRCLILGPWNYPINTVLCPLVSAVAAGNTVMLKPSELTPAVSALVADLVAEVFPPDEVAVVMGGVPTAQHLLSLPFNHIFFTGSPAVGKVVMKAAAEHLASVTLELGGRSPVIVDETADLELAASTLIWGKLINLGQSCVAPDHVFVHRSVRQRFVQACAEVIRQRHGATAEARQANPDLARLISLRHTDRLAGLLAQARALGAQVAIGGDVERASRYLAPTLLTDVPAEAALLSEELFGPLLPIIDYDELDDVIDQINDQPAPLALYVWSRRPEVARQVVARTASGGVCINHCMLHYAHGGLPFGGLNNSGIGNSHGEYGFRAFSHERAVLKAGWFMAARTMFPPYSPLKLRLQQGLVSLLRRL